MDPENQRLQLRRYCEAQRWEIAGEYVDYESGKSTENRKEFKRMFLDASRRQFDVVLSWALDRLTREGIRKTFELFAQLNQYGVKYESFSEPHFRTTGIFGDVIIAFAALAAQLERQRISERTKAGLERARHEGKTLGRPTRIFKVDVAAEMLGQGKTVREVARALKVSPMTVLRSVKRLNSVSQTSAVA